MLIDGHSMLNRAFYGLPDLTNAQGVHTGAVYGFLNILFKTLEEEDPDYMAVAFDLHGPTFRHKMFEAYKGTRKPMPDELREQVPLMQDMLRAMQVPILTLEGYEADDILGTVACRCEKEGLEVTILSGDRDLLQLATEHIKIRMPRTSRGKTTIEDFYAAQVLEQYQVTPKQIIELKALMGDSSDNIPGLPGVGEKTAVKLIVEYGGIDNAYAHLEEIKPNRAREAFRDHFDLALLSKTLATINTQSPVEFCLEEAKKKNLYTPEAYDLCAQLEFNQLLSRFEITPEQRKAAPYEDAYQIEDVQGLEGLLEKAAGLQNDHRDIGAALLHENGQIYALALVFSDDEIYTAVQSRTLSGRDLGSCLEKLNAFSRISCMDVKYVLKVVPLREDAVFDAGVAAYLLNPLKGSYTHDILARDFLTDCPVASREGLLKKKTIAQAWADADPGLAQLAAGMAFTAFACRGPLTEQLKDQGMWVIYRDIEVPLIFTLDSMEKWGIRVKGEELRAYAQKLQEQIIRLEKSIYEKAGEEFNINSPKQLGTILFEKMGIPGGRKTKLGYSTAADILEKLAPEQPIVEDILEYRTLTKLKSTYADGLESVIGPDGRIHSTFNQTITATGRISSTEPNLQNIPVRIELGRLIRKVFVPEEGFVFLDADYSQIELRVLAHMSGDEQLIRAYREAQDIHRLTASQVFHVPFDEVTPLQRRNAKAVNFGIVYGISSFGLSQDLSISRKEAQEYIEKYFETYPGIKAYLDGMVEKGKKDGYVTTMYGRRRPIPELSSGNYMQRSFGERVAMNSPIQGTAADIIKIAMNHVHARLKKEGLKSRLLLQVHDELLIETRKDEIEQVSRILEEEMKGAASLAVELEIDMHQGETWYDAK